MKKQFNLNLNKYQPNKEAKEFHQLKSFDIHQTL